MLKSAIMFSKAHLNFIVFAEDQLISAFTEKLDEWKTLTEDAFSYKVMSLVFPVDNPAEWRKLFKPCASQRLFLPVSRNYVFLLNMSSLEISRSLC